MKKLVLASIIAALLSGCVSNPSVQEIQATRPAVFNAKQIDAPPVCISAPPPVVNLDVTSSYAFGESSQSVIDPSRQKQLDAVAIPLEKFDATLNSYADRYAKDNDDVIAAQCVIAALDSWARGNALLGTMKGEWNGFASYGWQKWQLGEFAAVYFKVRDQATPEQDARIKWWMKQVAKPVKTFCDDSRNHRNTNHAAWCGSAIMQVGIITNDKADIEWARKEFNGLMNEVRADGSLPKEIARRSRALSYHNFALIPLAYMAQLSKVIGENWWKNEKLQRLIDFTINSQFDPSAIEKLAGIKQDGPPHWGWVALLPNGDVRRGKLMSPGSKGTVASVPYIGGDLVVFRDMVELKKETLLNVQPNGAHD